MDSALAVLSGGSVILNLNDCEADTRDCRLIRSDIGAVDVLFNQFSVAGYDGRADYEQRLPDLAEKILDNMVRNHRDMDAETTVPFASFIYFCTKDNAYINRYANKPADVHAAFQRARLSLDLLFPGESLEPGRPGATRDSLARFVDEYERFAAMPLYSAAQVELSDIEDAFRLRFQQLRSKYPKGVAPFAEGAGGLHTGSRREGSLLLVGWIVPGRRPDTTGRHGCHVSAAVVVLRQNGSASRPWE